MNNTSRFHYLIKKLAIITLIWIAHPICAQTNAKYVKKEKFSFPMNGNYCVLIENSQDSLFSYYSIFNRKYSKKTTGIYIEVRGNKIKFECYLKNGRLNGLYRKYDDNGVLKSYGKYCNNILIEEHLI